MSVVQEKTGCHVIVPVHRDLAPIIAAIPKRSVFVLTSSNGTPWTQDGFRTSWGRMTERLKLPDGLVFHGLRKSAVVMLLEAGCTDAEVSAITGQSRQMVEHYAAQVNCRKLVAPRHPQVGERAGERPVNRVCTTAPEILYNAVTVAKLTY
jgi:hypothetical protein